MVWTSSVDKGLRTHPCVLLAFAAMRSASYAILMSAFVFVVLWGVRPGAQRASNRFDILITKARIVDGTGAPWYRGDIGIVGDEIAAIGHLATATAQMRI